MQPAMETKWKKKKEKNRAECNSSGVYFCCKELADIYFNAERYDDALNEYNEMKQISIETNCKLDIGRADRMIGEVYCEKGEFNKAIIHQKNHLSIAREECDKVEEQRALATLGRTYFLLAESILDSSSEMRATALNEAKKFYMKSLDICHELTEENISSRQRMEMTGRLFLNIGLVLDCQNHYDDAINHMLKAVTICKKLDLWEDLYRTYAALGSIYHKHSDKKEALRTYELAVDVAERLPNKIQLVCELLLQKTDVLLDLPDLRGARQALLRAYKLKPSGKSLKNDIEKRLRTVAAMCEFEDNLTDLPPDDNFAERKKLYENLGDAASELNNYSLALTHYHLMLECVQKCGNKKKELIESYVSLAQTYKDNNQLSNALQYFKKELELEEINSPEACKTLLNIAEIYQLQENVEEMLATYSTAKSISSELTDLKLKRTVLKSFHYALTAANRVSEAEEVKRELNDLQLDVLMDSSDEEEDNTIQFGADICIDDLSDEEVANDVSKKAKLSRTRVRHKGTLEKKNEKGETPLHVASINGNVSLVKRLIEQGHRVDVKDYSGWTPLHEACNHGHIEVVKVLLDNKAPINDRGGAHCDGVTPLLDAASNGSLDVIELLLSYGASPLMRTNRGETVLDCLSSWRERRYTELGVDLDPITSAHYDSVYTNLKQTLEKAGQKVNDKEQNHYSNRTYKEPSTSHRSHISQAKQLSIEKRESTTEDYQSTMKALRRRSSNEKLVSLRTNKTSFPALLAEEETVGDDWLEVDIDIQRPSKKRRTDDLILGGRNKENVLYKKNISISFGSDDDKSPAEDFDLIDESSSDMDRLNQMNSEIEDTSFVSSQKSESSSESQRARLKEMTNIKKKQTSLLAAGVIKEKVAKTSINCNLNMQSTDNPSFSQQPNFTCIKVRIEDKTIVVPIPQSSFESLSISWLAKEAADRYRRLEGSEPVLRLEMDDGGLLVGSDPLAILMGISQIHARVLSWKVLSLTGLYKEACDNANVLVDAELNEILEACQATGSAAFDYMYLERKQLTPIFHTLSHHPPLQLLSITGTNISDNCVTVLAECLAKLAQLRSLDLSNINITSKGLEEICKAVKKQSGFQMLEKLKLGYNPLGDCLRPLAELMSLVPRLRYLALPSVGITSRSFSSFIHFTLECLEVLDLSFNDIGGEGLTDILGRLEAQTIVDLRLSNTGSHTIREIGFYLQHYTPLSLRSLDLSFCPTTQIEIDCLVKGVNMCKHLEKLLLDGLGETIINIEHLSIKELSICGTKFISGTTLPEQLKKLSLTQSSQVHFPLNTGPFGLSRLAS
ncbi:tonsoku-like protein [Halyomorpha halys]|uniref:tonsoku-like protein n=1 Tax=Halyomorpha halys TaxID=286706 RepID=UPI0006D4C6B0|nr:tonsoku-like protein [Halyomorpha halys]